MMLSNNTPNADSNTNVNVSITVGDIQVQFNGSAESILRSVINFMTKQVPTIDLARKISLSYEVMDLIDLFSNFIKITPEGPRVILDQEEFGMKKLSDKEIVALHLVAAKIGKDLGKVSNDGTQLSEIQFVTTLNPKSVSSRLSELVKAGHVLRDNTADWSESSTYKITTSGIHWLNSMLAKRVKG
jgi:predicted transcriptional regulator